MPLLRSLSLAATLIVTVASQAVPTSLNLPVDHFLQRDQIRFENLAVRSNGMILMTTTRPNASIYQADPLGILPLTIIHTFDNIANMTGAAGIVEQDGDVFLVASGVINIYDPTASVPDSYMIHEIDMRETQVRPNGTLTHAPLVREVARLPDARLLNGIAMARPQGNNLLVADSFQGLIWNVDLCDGSVDVALNDTTTRGPGKIGPTVTGVNGLKVHDDGTMYWTNTGDSSVWKVAIDEYGHLLAGHAPQNIATNMSCDDLVVDHNGDVYVAAPLNVLWKISKSGQKEIVAGTLGSVNSTLIGPTAARFGRLASDKWSLYVTTNGGFNYNVYDSCGLSRINLGAY